MKIYIAASWKHQHAVETLTRMLRDRGHVVLSFVENNHGEGTGKTLDGKPVSFDEWVVSPRGEQSFEYDTQAAMTSDLVVYIGPSGKDAAAELGMAWARGVKILGLHAKGEDFGLMRRMIQWYNGYGELLERIDKEQQTFMAGDCGAEPDEPEPQKETRDGVIVRFPHRILPLDFLDPVTPGWPVSAVAPAAVLPGGESEIVRSFASRVETGVGFNLRIPDGAWKMELAATVQGARGYRGYAGFRLRWRDLSVKLGGEWDLWEFPPFLVSSTLTINVGVVPLDRLEVPLNRDYQFELTRDVRLTQDAELGEDQLAGDLYLRSLAVKFL